MSKASAERIAEVLEEKEPTNPENLILEIENGDIDFNNVNFAYKKEAKNMYFKNIDLHIKSGETIEIIGGTGSSNQV